MADQREDAYCTLLMTDSYLPGAMVLAYSLRDAGTKKKLAALVLLENLATETVTELRKVYDYVIPVQRIINKTPANLYLMNRPDLGSTFTKINLWRQEQFRKIVYIDADVVALRAPDELFDRPSTFAAAPDVGWPDCFNSGVLVLSPNAQDYYGLLALAQRGISFDGADQGLLNMYFRQYDRMSFAYNCTPSAHYQYVPAYRHFQSSVSMIHFIGTDKPWQLGDKASKSSFSNSPYDEMLGRWWAVYDRHYKVPATASISGQGESDAQSVRQHVQEGSSATTEYGYSSTGPTETGSSTDNRDPEPQSKSPEQIQPQPTHTHPERHFSPPLVDWNPSMSAPPENSKAEAANFHTESYSMSTSGGLFEAPQSYPAPPKDMWYEVPKEAPAGPKPIFPWEKLDRPKPTRVFAEDTAPTVNPIFPWERDDLRAKPTRIFAEDINPSAPREPPLVSSEPSSEEDAQSGEKGTHSPKTPVASAPPSDPWTTYTRTNAWDEMPDIERYVASIARARRGKVQVLVANDTEGKGGEPGDVNFTTAAARRPSTKLTDFPTEIERPSLPVTPAPIRRPSYWDSINKDDDATAAAQDEEGEAGSSSGGGSALLPTAAGVPNQAEWNPAAQLEELTRRQSDLPEMLLALKRDQDLLEGNGPSSKVIPDRDLPPSSSGVLLLDATAPEASPTASASSKAHSAFTAVSSAPTLDEDGEEEVAQPTTKAGASAVLPLTDSPGHPSDSHSTGAQSTAAMLEAQAAVEAERSQPQQDGTPVHEREVPEPQLAR